MLYNKNFNMIGQLSSQTIIRAKDFKCLKIT